LTEFIIPVKEARWADGMKSKAEPVTATINWGGAVLGPGLMAKKMNR
jgi:hypothetical protein